MWWHPCQVCCRSRRGIGFAGTASRPPTSSSSAMRCYTSGRPTTRPVRSRHPILKDSKHCFTSHVCSITQDKLSCICSTASCQKFPSLSPAYSIGTQSTLARQANSFATAACSQGIQGQGPHSVMAQVWLVVLTAPRNMSAISGRSCARVSGLPVSGSSMRFRQPHMLLSSAATGPFACSRPTRWCELNTRQRLASVGVLYAVKAAPNAAVVSRHKPSACSKPARCCQLNMRQRLARICAYHSASHAFVVSRAVDANSVPTSAS